MSAHKMQLERAEPFASEPYAATDDYELIEAAVLETARGRWFLAEHARRERSDERGRMMFAMRRLERVAEENMEALRFHQVADELARKLDDVLRSLPKLEAQDQDTSQERRRIEQRLIEPRPFIAR